jgi:hypothetical protein
MIRCEMEFTMKRGYRTRMVCFLALIFVVAGCGKESGEKTKETKAGSNDSPVSVNHGGSLPVTAGISPAKQNPGQLAGEKIVGIWYGVANLDMDKVQAKLATLEQPEVRQQFLAMAETVQSMRVGTEFKPDGTVEVDIEIRPSGGEPQRESTIGTWRIIEQDSQRVLIETIEPTHDPEHPQIKQVQYNFYDNNIMAIRAPVSQDFADCDPSIVFQRQTVSENAIQRVTKEQGANTQK